MREEGSTLRDGADGGIQVSEQREKLTLGTSISDSDSDQWARR